MGLCHHERMADNPNAFKHWIGKALLRKLAREVDRAQSGLETRRLRALMPRLAPLELKDRVRLVRDTLREYEFVVIREVEGRLRYEARPSGQPPATFPQKTLTDTLVEFEDPAHDYPQRIGYRKVGADSVIAWIDGTTAQGARKVEFPYARATCGA